MDDLVYYDFTDNEWVPVTPAGDKPVSIHLILSDEENEMKHGKWQLHSDIVNVCLILSNSIALIMGSNWMDE